MSLPTSSEYSAWLPAWLVPHTSVGGPTVRNDVVETTRPGSIERRLALMLLDAFARVDIARRCFERLGWSVAGSRVTPSTSIQKRHGNFGETLTIGLLRELWGLTVPIVKLRYNPGPEQTLHGADVVGFACQRATSGKLEVQNLDFVEVKVRVSNDRGVLCKAHDQLAEESSNGFLDALDFLYHRLESESQLELLDAFEDYLADRSTRTAGNHRLCLVIDQASWREVTIEDLHEKNGLLEPLTVDVVHICDLQVLISDSWSAVGPELLEDRAEVPSEPES